MSRETKITIRPPKPKKEKKRKLFDNIEYKHTARLSRNAWFLRLWAWAWGAKVENADFCKLFWGMVTMPFNLFVRAIILPVFLLVMGVKKVGRTLDRMIESGVANKPALTKDERVKLAAKEERSEIKKKAREQRVMKFFAFVSRAADRVVGLAQKCWPVVRVIVYGVGGILAAAGAVLLAWGVVLLVGLIAANISGVANVLLIIGALAGAIGVIVGIMVGTVLFLAETKPGEAILRFLDRVVGAFFRAMFVGVRGVKSRTCPKIELVSSKKN